MTATKSSAGQITKFVNLAKALIAVPKKEADEKKAQHKGKKGHEKEKRTK